ncbi:ATP-binding protein [Dactylosporangium sp. NPDC005555]|uniref:sensor histidine kinase n=1 Tax=Dactylosporangium sp. NPDC005555 TaxID=3154889 RepID=UPI0033B36106
MGVRLQVFGVVLLGLLVSGGAGLLMHRVELVNAGQTLDRRVAAAQESVASTAQRYVDAVQLTAGGLEAVPAVDARSFATATAPLGQLWLPGATSVGFVVAVQDQAGMVVSGLALTAVTAMLVHTLATSRRRAEERVTQATADLRHQATLLSAVMSTIGDGVVVLDAGGAAVWLNPRARELLGDDIERHPTAEWARLLDAYEADGTTPYEFRDLVRRHLESQVEAIVRGRRLDIRIRALVRHGGAEGHEGPEGPEGPESPEGPEGPEGADGAVAVLRDITERRTAELAVEQVNAELEVRVAERTADLREANAELESFSYSVSHDLRAPLRAVDGFAKMLALDHGDALDDQGRRYLARIRAGAQHMGELIDGLLAFSRLQRQEMASLRVHVDQLVADVWEELGVERGTRDLVLTVGDLPDAEGDPRLIRHVVANLVGNAVKYTRDVSPATIEIGHRVTAGGDATYYVKDNGAGFDMRYADKLFKVFQRLHRAEDYEGTGIGLALTHRIVLRHGGQIWADAAPGEGATFYFTLPAYARSLLEVGG